MLNWHQKLSKMSDIDDVIIHMNVNMNDIEWNNKRNYLQYNFQQEIFEIIDTKKYIYIYIYLLHAIIFLIFFLW